MVIAGRTSKMFADDDRMTEFLRIPARGAPAMPDFSAAARKRARCGGGRCRAQDPEVRHIARSWQGDPFA
jgi:hypothetical protein